MESIKEEIKKETNELKINQAKLNKLMKQNFALETKLNENKLVKEEFNKIEENKNKNNQNNHFIIFKSITSVLIQQDFSESKSIVNRRIDLLNDEILKINKKVQSAHSLMDKSRSNIIEMQTKLQQLEVPSKKLSETHLLNPIGNNESN